MLYIAYPETLASQNQSVLIIPQLEEQPTEWIINYYADFYNIDSELALNIALCESKLSHTAQNPTSSAYGTFQWIQGSYEHYSNIYTDEVGPDRKDKVDNIKLAILVIRDYGTDDWDPSKECWQGV